MAKQKFKTLEKTSEKPKPRKKPARWLLNAYLYLLIFINGMVVLVGFSLWVASQKLAGTELQKLPASALELSLLISIVNIYFILNIIRGWRWGFWGYCLSSLALVGLSKYMGATTLQAFLGLGGPAVLFILLYMGGKRSAWNELK